MKSSYNPEETPRLAAIYARDGLIDKEIAAKLGIATGTIYEWKKRYPEFAEALKRTKEIVDAEVVDSLYKRAMGITYEERKVTGVEVSGKLNVQRVEVTKKFIPPSEVACIFWLKNRQKEYWRDRPLEPVRDPADNLTEYTKALENAAADVWQGIELPNEQLDEIDAEAKCDVEV